MSLPEFIHLRVFSDYSLGKGAVKINSLISECIKNDYPAVALTDYNSLSGSLEFSSYALKNGIQPIIGLDQTIEFEHNLFANVLLLAKNQEGYENLLQISSDSYTECTSTNTSIKFQDLENKLSGLVVITAGINSYEQFLFKEKKHSSVKEHLNALKAKVSDDLYIEINRWDGKSSEDQSYEEFILDLAYELDIKIVATNYVCFLNKEMHEAHDVLTCISKGRYLIEENRPKTPPSFYLKKPKEMKEVFSDLSEALHNTIEIAQKCIVFSENRNPLLPSFTSGSRDEGQELKKQSINGLKERISNLDYKIDEDEYFKRLDYEISVIEKMKYPGYFLIVSDFIKWSKENGIPVGPGRGSGAGSVVAWALKITDLDPLKYGLLFERFLNPDRVSMPDFDIDFCQEKREQVIKYVQQKYGKEQVSQIITFGKLQARAVLRDVGRVMHIPYGAIDKICKMVPNNPANPVTLGQAISLDKELQKSRDNDSEIKKLLDISLKLEGLNRHSSTHAAGIVIADRPIVKLVPLYREPSSEMPAVQYSMKYAEAAGLVKFDFLGLKTLTVINWSSNYIKEHTEAFSIDEISLTDEKAFKLLSEAKTVGVFQFESAGMKEAIKNLKPDSIEDLIALGSLYRPGPMDNIPSYIDRKHGREKPTYLHEKMEPILEETFGIIVYQEQVMEIAKQVAGYTLGQADLLRRAMGKKIKSEMEAQRNIFYEGCKKNNIDKNKAEEIFNLIEKFASYGFNKSHAAAYAVISYQTAYLKANYTKEFLTASINLEINDTDKINLFIEDAKIFDIEILGPCVNNSESMFKIQNESIRFGIAGIKNVGKKVTDLIFQERKENGNYKSIFDFLERLADKGINKRLLENLTKSGALDCIHKNRRQLLDNIDVLIKFYTSNSNETDSRQIGLFFEDSATSNINYPELHEIEDYTSQEKLNLEFEAFGFYLSSHPLENYSDELKHLKLISSQEVETLATETSKKVTFAGVVTSRKIRSSKMGRYAFLQISDIAGMMEASIFNESLLIENEENITPGKVIVAQADLKRDVKGLRLVIEKVDNILDLLKSRKLFYDVEISSSETIKMLQDIACNDNEDSVYIKPIVKLENEHKVYLSCKQPIKLNKSAFNSLRDKEKIKAKINV